MLDINEQPEDDDPDMIQENREKAEDESGTGGIATNEEAQLLSI